LSFAQVQAAYDGYGQDDDCEVGQDIDSSVREPHGELVYALSLLFGPERPDRNTGKDTREDCPKGVTNDDGHDGPIRNLKGLCWENAPVLEKHGSFGQSKRHVVNH
jgi:hypothetical protein